MVHPIFSVILRRPDLLARHLSNHAELVRAEFAQAKRALVLKAVAGLGAGVSLPLALGLSATAIMLAVVERFHWALIAVPCLAWLIFIACALTAIRATVQPKAGEVREQVEADLDLLRHVRTEAANDRQ
ncbi:phage holin family protein [Variovorax sp. M-6]|uniref:phage holin family protein n=1 Tax=Variovorax sp. M-6 TaxID=3233041 RepID=UPI003F9B1605